MIATFCFFNLYCKKNILHCIFEIDTIRTYHRPFIVVIQIMNLIQIETDPLLETIFYCGYFIVRKQFFIEIAPILEVNSTPKAATLSLVSSD